MRKKLLLAGIIALFTAFVPRPITWVAIGDSITYLNEHADETGNRVREGYLTRVVAQLPGIQYTNQGHNGWTAIRIAAEIEQLGITKADVYTVFLGTNDWWGGKTLGTINDYENNTGNANVYGAFRTIINKLRSLNEAAKIILITPMQRVDFVYIANYKNNAFGSYRPKNGQTLEQFAEAINTIGKKEHLTVIDLYHKRGISLANLVKFKHLKNPQTGMYQDYPYPSFIDIPFNPETDEYPYPPEASNMTYDGLHPSDKGNQVIADMLVKQMKKIKPRF